MGLYEEIIFLKHYAKCEWVVENVIPYYEALIRPTIEMQRHLFWSSFKIRPYEFKREQVINITKPSDTVFGFNISGKKIKHRKDQYLETWLTQTWAYIF